MSRAELSHFGFYERIAGFIARQLKRGSSTRATDCFRRCKRSMPSRRVSLVHLEVRHSSSSRADRNVATIASPEA